MRRCVRVYVVTLSMSGVKNNSSLKSGRCLFRHCNILCSYSNFSADCISCMNIHTRVPLCQYSDLISLCIQYKATWLLSSLPVSQRSRVIKTAESNSGLCFRQQTDQCTGNSLDLPSRWSTARFESQTGLQSLSQSL